MFKQLTIPAVAAAALLIPAGEALAAAPQTPAAVTDTAACDHQSFYEYFGLVRSHTDTWDGRPVFRLSSEAARSGEGVYFMVSNTSREVLRRYLDPFGLDSSDWRKVLFALPRDEISVSVKFGDPDDPSVAETVAGVRACGG
ncbi:hypothetical protein [Streptomyces sp. NPDC096030]|uniref:hypothetical protein n=1 Tax=Streptomyces sp. NPDC096030 TaxID=3155423 RepID=UPI003323669F